MRNIRKLLAGTALAGSLAAGLAAAPAAQASTTDSAGVTSATEAQSSRHFFPIRYSDFGRGENRGDRSYFKGYWEKFGGRYYFSGHVFDRDDDRNRDYNYLEFRWHDDRGFHHKIFKSHGEFNVNRYGGFRKSEGFDSFAFRVGEGHGRDYDWGNWYRRGF
ncbi:hypothetical protein GCM10022226_75880 [Sphaerisporangium flaviroseum]|uniref:Uncharacterized protein n=1 Tax=Sphaerisporangium flaviroseum TaxID=509199 RepID=A0ABP7JDH8_9ACTN